MLHITSALLVHVPSIGQALLLCYTVHSACAQNIGCMHLVIVVHNTQVSGFAIHAATDCIRLS